MCKKVICFVFFVVFALSAESIKLTGTVVSKGSKKPLEGVIVTLNGEKLSDTTNDKGEFKITRGVGVKPVEIVPRIENVSVERNQIRFSLSKPSEVKVEMFDMSGKMLSRALSTFASAGEYRFDLNTGYKSSQVMAIKVSVGNYYTSTFRYLTLPDGNRTVRSSVSPMKSTGTKKLAKIQATIDSLSTLSGRHYTKSVPVSDYETSNIVIELDTLAHFSFFVTSLESMQELSGSPNGFGGDLRFGKTGQGAGLLGADSICGCIAEMSMKGSSVKQWRAFLSAVKGPDGKQVDAKDRVGKGPWYDRNGRLVASNLENLLKERPGDANATIKNDLPNEYGFPNKKPDPTAGEVDNHHMITGTGSDGKLYKGGESDGRMQGFGGGGFGGGWGGGGGGQTVTVDNYNCDDWTSTTANSTPRAGFSYPQNMWGLSGTNWMSGWDASGCEAGVDVSGSSLAGVTGVKTVGNGGGYGGFYCLSLNP
ncbi:MAG: hypothetical protein Q4F84_08600 [Fibrobacter sp.]|nr:hypothetical protein [Fibrobacter sp.]